MARTIWQAVRDGEPGEALPAYFPEAAYLQVKALRNDASDYRGRPLGHFDLDVDAAHQLLGAGAGDARLLRGAGTARAGEIDPVRRDGESGRARGLRNGSRSARPVGL